jgi:hypothetical protein
MTMKQAQKRKHQLTEDMLELLWLAEAKAALKKARAAVKQQEAIEILAKLKGDSVR